MSLPASSQKNTCTDITSISNNNKGRPTKPTFTVQDGARVQTFCATILFRWSVMNIDKVRERGTSGGTFHII